MINKIKGWFVSIWSGITSNNNSNIVKSIMNIANEITNRTKTDIDNAALAVIATAIRYETKELSLKDLKEVAATINKTDKGILDSFKLEIGEEIKLKTRFGSVSYDYDSGRISWLQ